ncbi:hypothetical protein CUJ83_05135 [Methanocella sp. CWC-04]|uniref:Uncharacterized protein n=1 Tax=Methanooceanicella nereidis TaxID=2052831 RepID=A0AAP2RC73_9EURY|nr:hypothetical protein [Methanocella sp. CWC-04]MCD1294382.1 hypothetical protein [Methanocella sp. CWC-04]
MRKIIILVSIFIALAISGCIDDPPGISPTNTPVAGDNGLQGVVIDPEELMKSDIVLSYAATGLEIGDKGMFLSSLSGSFRQQVGSDIDIESFGAMKLAECIRDARMVIQTEDLIMYEMAIDGETYSFYTIKEDGEWKIGGL